MSSARTNWWRRTLHRVPFLFKTCPAGNKHWVFDRLCFCRSHEHVGDWHGGIYDFKTKHEYQHCAYCKVELEGSRDPEVQQEVITSAMRFLI
jgi:hypothetical protein